MHKINNLATLSLIIGLLCSVVFSYGQNSDFNIESDILVNSFYTSTAIDADRITQIANAAHGSVNEVESGGEFFISYIPDSNFVGTDHFAFEIQKGFPLPFSTLSYLQFTITVGNSLLEPKEDYYTIYKGTADNYLSALDNDFTTAGGLTYKIIPASTGGVTTINQDSLTFTPDVDFIGMSYVQYVVCDSFNLCKESTINISVLDTSTTNTDEIKELSVAHDSKITEFLGSSLYYIDLDPQLGTIDFITNSDAFSYSPSAKNGIDTFILGNGINTTEYRIQIIEIDEDNSFLMDDYFSGYENQSLTFDVLDNDVVGNFYIDDNSNPDHGSLSDHGDGTFTFTPDSNFTGKTTFTYEICIFNTCEEAVVTLDISNFIPESDTRYVIPTNKNRSILLDYDAPVQAYFFQSLNDPIHGNLDITNGVDTIPLGCESNLGFNFMIYKPNDNFVGSDFFEIEYCFNTTDCHIVKFEIQVLDTINLDSCHCADDCVWPGDINADGQVSLVDVLSLGREIGGLGVLRPNGNGDDWLGQYAPTWTSKHADANGDGYITTNDVNPVYQFYGLKHNMVVPAVGLPKRPFDIGITLDVDTIPTIGDTIGIYIYAGDQALPVKEMHGLSMSLFFPPSTFDTTYMPTSLVNENWLTREGVPLYFNRAKGGNLDLALSRVDGQFNSGHGFLFKLEIIIEDNLDGFRPENNIINLPVQIDNIHMLDANDVVQSMPGLTAYIPVKLSNNNTEAPNSNDEQSFIVSPNPASDYIIVESKDIIQNVQIKNLVGQTVFEQRSNSNQIQIATDHLVNGTYIIEARIGNSNQSSLLQIVK